METFYLCMFQPYWAFWAKNLLWWRGLACILQKPQWTEHRWCCCW